MDLSTELVALASGGAGTLVGAMTTDAWDQAKSAVAALWKKHRPAESNEIQELLEASRSELLTVADPRREEAQAELESQWRALLEDLLAEHPDAAEDLATLVATADNRAGSVTQIVRAGHDAFAAGRDQTVNFRIPD